MCENEPRYPRVRLTARIGEYLAGMEAAAKRADDGEESS